MLPFITNSIEYGTRELGVTYGNVALEIDKIQTQIRKVQTELLTQCRTVIGCEIANILFLSKSMQQLYLFADEKWHGVPLHSSIAGTCANTGETIHVHDAYADNRFNRSIDKETGYHTRDILCMPVLNEMKSVVAVVQMLNKIAPGGFEQGDVQVLESCVRRVAGELLTKFQDLLNFADNFTAMGNFLNPVYTINPDHRLDDSTTASRLYAVRHNTSTSTDIKSRSDSNNTSNGIPSAKSIAKLNLNRRLHYGSDVSQKNSIDSSISKNGLVAYGPGESDMASGGDRSPNRSTGTAVLSMNSDLRSNAVVRESTVTIDGQRTVLTRLSVNRRSSSDNNDTNQAQRKLTDAQNKNTDHIASAVLAAAAAAVTTSSHEHILRSSLRTNSVSCAVANESIAQVSKSVTFQDK